MKRLALGAALLAWICFASFMLVRTVREVLRDPAYVCVPVRR